MCFMLIKLSMKKIFIQLLQWIFKYRKKIIYGALALFVGQICFFNVWWIGVQNQVFAASNENAEQRKQFEGIVNKKLAMVDFFRKAVYVLVYPVLFLAGKLVDNSFVYGEVFQFDVVLWKLWNIVRNLANYGLWFIFLFYIFKYVIKKDEKEWPKRLIKNALIAWIWIQASWFIMAVLIDISTILIYSVWWLPISILWWGSSSSASEMIEKDQDYDPYVMKTIVSVDADDIANMNVYLTNIPVKDESQKIIYISECDTFSFKYADNQKLSEEFILAPKMIYYKDEKKKENSGDTSSIYHNTQELLCDYFGSVYWFTDGNRLIKELEWPSSWCSGDTDCSNKQLNYNWKRSEVKNAILQDENKLNKYLEDHQVLRVWEIVSKEKDKRIWWDQDNNWINEKYKTQRLHQLIKDQDTKSYVWVFTTLYTSLLESWRWMVSVEGKSVYVQFLGWLVALWHVLAISIPLIAALLVFIMRIWIIWMAVVLSPMIALFTAFGFSDKFADGKFLSYFKITNLIKIIFAPAIICFAISMSTVLIRIIEKVSFDDVFTQSIPFGWVIQMNIAWFSVWLWKLITWVIWIAISWFLVWLAVVESSELWKKVSGLKDLATSALWSVKFIPVMGKNGQWQLASVNGLKSVYENKIQKVKDKFSEWDSKALNELFDRSSEKEKASENNKQYKLQTFLDWLKESQTLTADWEKWFNEFDESQQKSIIQKINWDKSLAEKIWKVTQEITIKVGDKNEAYKYDPKNKEFKVENSK